MHRVTALPISILNQYLTCRLCGGYLIDATTIVECLHSFCRSCILSYLKLNTICPVCETLLHKTRPHYAIKSDGALQAIIYKLIPNLFEKEMDYRRKFYKDNSLANVRSLSPEKRGEISLNTYVCQEEDYLSIELRHWENCTTNERLSYELYNYSSQKIIHQPFYLLCSSEMTVGHLEKLIRIKFNLKPGEHKINVFFSEDDLFNSDYTLSDLVCLYVWYRQEPLKLYYEIKEIVSVSTPFGSDDEHVRSCSTEQELENEYLLSTKPKIDFSSVKIKLVNTENVDQNQRESKSTEINSPDAFCNSSTESKRTSPSCGNAKAPLYKLPCITHSIQNVSLSSGF